jgi:hypothetical protein
LIEELLRIAASFLLEAIATERYILLARR